MKDKTNESLNNPDTDQKESDENQTGNEKLESLDPSEMAKALKEAQNKVKENWDLYLGTRADIENTRRRAKIDVENAHKYAIERFSKDMLAVVDSLEQGLQVADSVKDEAYHQGLELTLKICFDIFEKYGIKVINPVGAAFDPTKHEVLTTQVSAELEPNRVVSVIQKGFILNDRVLRPARVIVSKKEEKK